MNINQFPSILSHSSKVTIKGKKITSTTQVQVSNPEKSAPNKIFQKKSSPPKHQKSPPTHPLSKKPPKPCNTTTHPNPANPLKKHKFKPQKPVSKTCENKDPEKSASGQSLLKPKLRSIIKSSLKKEKIQRIVKEKEKKAQIEKKEQKKLDMNKQNIQIRIENTKWKKVKLRHRPEWGVDQSRINARDHSSERPTSRKAKSTERVRGNLENLREYLYEQGRSFTHNRTLSHGSENSGPLKPKYYKDPKVIEYMKNKKLEIKQQQEMENLQKVAQDSRKLDQLNKLELIRKALKAKQKLKKQKKSKTSRKSKENSKLYTEDKKKGLYQLNLVYEPSKFDGSCESLSLRGITTSQRVKESAAERSASIKKIKYDPKTSAAIKIQSLIRRFLVRCRIFKQDLSFSTDEIVKEILEKKIDTESSIEVSAELMRVPGKKQLEIMILSESQSEESGLDSSEGGIDLSEEIKESVKVEKDELKEKIVTMEAQLQTLEYLKTKEIQDLWKITEKAGMDLEVGNMLSAIIVKRYSQLSCLLEGNIHEAKENFFKLMNTEEKQSFYCELKIKLEQMTKFIDSDTQNIEALSKNFKSPKAKPTSPSAHKLKPTISYEDPVETPQFSAILSPNAHFSPSYEYSIQHLSIEEEPKEISTLIIEDFQISSATSSQNLSLNLISPKNSEKLYKNLSVLQENVSEHSSLYSEPPFDSELKSYTPDYLPERPSAPLNYFDSESHSPDTNPSPSVSRIQVMHDQSSCIEWMAGLTLDITPELVVNLAESIILDLIDEHEAFDSEKWEILKIRTDPEAVLEYSENIYKFANVFQLVEGLKKPLEGNPLVVLRQIRENLFDSGNWLVPSPEVLSLNIYLELETQLDREKKTDRPLYVSEEIHAWLIEAEHIHNKLIFDANNEVLGMLRPSSLKVLPLPFVSRQVAKREGEKILKKVLNTVMNWSQFQVGKIYTAEMVNSSEVIDDDMFQQMREDNLAKMLVSEIVMTDPDWHNYEFEEIQTKIDLADDIVEFLTDELLTILNNFC